MGAAHRKEGRRGGHANPEEGGRERVCPCRVLLMSESEMSEREITQQSAKGSFIQTELYLFTQPSGVV